MRQPVNKTWDEFRRDERCTPGVVVFFDEDQEGTLLGDLNRMGGTCNDCTDVGNVVREVLDLRDVIALRVLITRGST